MKKLIMPLLLATTLTSTTASASGCGDCEELLSVTGSGVAVTATAATFYPVPVLASVSSFLIYDYFLEGLFYEGLSEDSIDVLAGNSSVEDSLSLSMFKEDLLNNQEAVEAKFEEHGLDVDLEQISDEELAELALATAQAQK